MKKFVSAIALLFAVGAACAQAGTAVKDSGKATAETPNQRTENVKCAPTSEPESTAPNA